MKNWGKEGGNQEKEGKIEEKEEKSGRKGKGRLLCLPLTERDCYAIVSEFEFMINPLAVVQYQIILPNVGTIDVPQVNLMATLVQF